ncbi:hypothetical protein FXW30_01210 [Candidatus Liberibacter asiaticus]|nr:hypothetical protein FXW22_01570 [Candidatus Liberibacter asiaticus]KAE9511122.1 hypothetical protein FXW31_03140 [Candidatus Liberibacter asiaticus]KAE9512477.1 hypothetical protein FXW32_01400 [Candidatus Liberibacter asiaticus]KAE9513557.1 hypothetical protein FXW35_01720 [Candidatus Liberibacter asiaticus]KAE9514642.1 hypothetical protein FXW25_01540 [Candidatus Liberibacter asiaticus]
MEYSGTMRNTSLVTALRYAQHIKGMSVDNAI